MKIIAAALLYCLWPFHHRPVARIPENISTITAVGAEAVTAQDRQGCEITPDGYLFLGEDAMVGISKDSCEAAFQAWRRNPPPRTPLLRA